MALHNPKPRAYLRRLKLILVEAIFAISDHEREDDSHDMSSAKDRWRLSILFRLRCELHDMLLQLHVIERVACRTRSDRAAALIAVATRSAKAQLPVIMTARTATRGARQLIAIILELRADLEATAEAAACG